jgi:polyvinyl alcohol dehydrogenase (cytochrome)
MSVRTYLPPPRFGPRLGAVCALAVLVLVAAEAQGADGARAFSGRLHGWCSAEVKGFAQNPDAPGWNGWGVSRSNTRFQPAAAAELTAGAVRGLRLKWAFGFPGATMAFSEPAVAHAVLFVGSESGRIYALDTRSGCIHWSFKAQAAVRTGFVLGRGLLYFGDQHGAVYALDASSGRLRWKARADSHRAAMITGTPQLWRGRLFVPVASYEENFAADPHYPCCSFRGSVVAYWASSGRVIWKTYTVRGPSRRTRGNRVGTRLWGPSGSAVWSAPTLDPRRGVLYVATGNNYSAPATDSSDAVLAMSMATGRILWAHQLTSGDAYNAGCEKFMDPTLANCPPTQGSDFDFGSSPILVREPGGRPILIAPQKSGIVYGLDPVKAGRIIWRTRIGKGGPLGGIEWGAASDGKNVYVGLSDCDWKTFWRVVNGKRSSYVDMDPHKGGGLFALRVSDGAKLWEALPSAACAGREHCSPAQLAAVTAIPGVVFAGSLDGNLRAYSARSGRVLWDYDTAREFSTVNRVRAHGGSLNGPGVVVAGGMVFANSGYSRFGEAPGNVLLAFGTQSTQTR